MRSEAFRKAVVLPRLRSVRAHGGIVGRLGVELVTCAGFVVLTVACFQRSLWLFVATLANHGRGIFFNRTLSRTTARHRGGRPSA